MSFQAAQRSILPAIAFSAALLLCTSGMALQKSGPGDVEAGSETSAAATTGGGTVKGTVADPDSAVIPGATVTLTPIAKGGRAIVVKSQGDGSYTVPNVPAGMYSETVTMPGFASFVKLGVKVAEGQALTIDARMAIQSQNQQVNVTANGATLSTDPDSNASSTVIKGKDLEALSDDPDELSSELTALAGPAAGPNGGQIYVDGFTGGQLPPKSSIREIRINQNPFSAQYDRVGYGRVEVFTKPGADKFHGYFQSNGNANFFNTQSPYLGSAPQQPYHQIFVFGSLTGPLSHKASFSLGGSHRIIQDNLAFFGSLLANSPTATTPCAPGDTTCTLYPAVGISSFFPQVRTDFTPRIDYQLAEKNTLTVRYQYAVNSQHNNGIGQFDLPSTGYNLDSTENEIQLVDSQIINSKMVNETRFEYERNKSTQAPLTKSATVTVQGSFTGGGSGTQTVNDHQDHFEVQNYTSLALAKNFIRFGGRLRTTRDANYSNSDSLGIFTYSCLQSTDATCQTNAAGQPLAYDTGLASQYVVARIAQPSVHATLADLGLYAEDDWKARPNLTVTYGLRYETQSHLRDHHDFAPRFSFAYGLGSNKTSPQTVIRGGFGVFYDRFSLNNVITTEQENGTNRTIFTISAPGGACTPTNQTAAACGTTGAGTQTTYALAPSLRSSYTMQAAIGLDEQLGKIGTISFNYIASRGVHEFNSEDLSAPVPEADGAIVLNPVGTPNIYQYASNGVFRQKQFTISPRINYSRSISLWGFYSLSYAQSDTSGSGSFSSVANNLGADYGRAAFDVRSRLYAGGSFTAPYKVTFSPFMAATSGQPFNIITGTDLNGDGILSNDRPAFCGANPVKPVLTSHGCFDTTPTPGEKIVPINSGTGPAEFTLNLRVTKTIGFGPETGAKPVAGAAAPSGPPGGGRGGPGGGGRGGGGPFGGGGASSGRRYSLSLGAVVNNVFNDYDRGTPSGVVGSPNFYQSTGLIGQVFTSNSAIRRISLTASFSF